jgi:hypothetical protein
MSQIQIDWNQVPHTKENNSFSETILAANIKKIRGNCKKTFDLLTAGKRLTVNGAVKEHDISSLPRRIKDIEEKLGIQIKRDVVRGPDSKYTEYYL